MGMLYRRKKKDSVTGKLIERGPYWMKYYDDGRPVYQSTGKTEKREAIKVLQRAEGKVLDGQREGPAVHRTRFEDLIEGLKRDYELKGRTTWTRRVQHIAHLKTVFGGVRVKAIRTEHLQGYVSK